MTVRRKERSRRIKHETDKYEKISGGSRFLCCRSGRKFIFISGSGVEMFTDSASGECHVCYFIRSMVWTGGSLSGSIDS